MGRRWYDRAMRSRPFPIVVVIAFAPATVLAAPASAQPGDDTTSSMRAEMLGYYHGEQLSAYVVGGLGLAAAGTGAYLVTRDGDLARGLGWSFVALGSLEVIGAIGYALAVDGEIDHYDAALSRDPAAYRDEEAAHIEGTTSRFVWYRAIEIGLVVVGAAMVTYGWLSERDAWTGAGIGIASLALPLVVIDTINDARAHAYLESVRDFQPAVAIRPDGVHLTVRGRL